MARTGQEFRRHLKVRADEIAKNTSDAVRKIALFVDQQVVMGTPVDTGRARSNWVVSVGMPFEGELEPYAPGEKLGIGEGANAGAAIAQGQRVIAENQWITDGESIFITNNVHYIGLLNDGSSPQAPPYYVEQAIVDAIALLKSVKLMRG